MKEEKKKFLIARIDDDELYKAFKVALAKQERTMRETVIVATAKELGIDIDRTSLSLKSHSTNANVLQISK